MRPTGDVAQLEINSLTGLARGREKVATLEPTNNLRISKLISSYFVNVYDGKPLFSVFRRTEVVVRILQTARNFELLKTKVESRSWWRHTLETLYEAWKLFLVLQHYSAAIFIGFWFDQSTKDNVFPVLILFSFFSPLLNYSLNYFKVINVTKQKVNRLEQTTKQKLNGNISAMATSNAIY